MDKNDYATVVAYKNKSGKLFSSLRELREDNIKERLKSYVKHLYGPVNYLEEAYVTVFLQSYYKQVYDIIKEELGEG